MGWHEVFEQARRWNGALHVTDGRAHGISARALDGRARRERWPRPHPGVVLAPGVVPDRLTVVSAGIKAVGEPVYAGRRTAAWLHGVLNGSSSSYRRRAARHVCAVSGSGGRGPCVPTT